MKDKVKIIIAILSTIAVMSAGYMYYLSVPQHTEYYVKNDDGTKTQIAVVSENKHSGKKNVYLSTYDKVYHNESDAAIDWSIELSADYVYGRDVKVHSHKLSFWDKPKLMKINK